MPYYCTVPRCTSMAGKAKNVSFHQFPRDEELALLWNNILKRGKPYTKYSKVCSLHFKPEDYTITSVGKNKGQWRTLRKDAIPSQNLPSDSPVPHHRSRSSSSWNTNSLPQNVMDPLIHQQIAQAIYMQTMMAMQAGADRSIGQDDTELGFSNQNLETPQTSYQLPLPDIEIMLKQKLEASQPKKTIFNDSSFECVECSKCFKDPDVFLLHQRTHKTKTEDTEANVSEKENVDMNVQEKLRQATLNSNPILANLLRTLPENANSEKITSILNVEKNILAALTANIEAHIKNMANIIAYQNVGENTYSEENGSENGCQSDVSIEDETIIEPIVEITETNGIPSLSIEENCVNSRMVENGRTDVVESKVSISNLDSDSFIQVAPDCDKQDLNITKDYNLGVPV